MSKPEEPRIKAPRRGVVSYEERGNVYETKRSIFTQAIYFQKNFFGEYVWQGIVFYTFPWLPRNREISHSRPEDEKIFVIVRQGVYPENRVVDRSSVGRIPFFLLFSEGRPKLVPIYRFLYVFIWKKKHHRTTIIAILNNIAIYLDCDQRRI